MREALSHALRSGELPDDFDQDIDQHIGRWTGISVIVSDRREADKLNHFIRWFKSKVEAVGLTSPKERESYARHLLGHGLIADHAIGHLYFVIEENHAFPWARRRKTKHITIEDEWIQYWLERTLQLGLGHQLHLALKKADFNQYLPTGRTQLRRVYCGLTEEYKTVSMIEYQRVSMAPKLESIRDISRFMETVNKFSVRTRSRNCVSRWQWKLQLEYSQEKLKLNGNLNYNPGYWLDTVKFLKRVEAGEFEI